MLCVIKRLRNEDFIDWEMVSGVQDAGEDITHETRSHVANGYHHQINALSYLEAT